MRSCTWEKKEKKKRKVDFGGALGEEGLGNRESVHAESGQASGRERNIIKASDRDKAGERKPSDGFLFGGQVEITSFH